ncbi:hypothetical protein J6590_044299 [Homalodisca vitripennis]|nr:hypothetical protein J6590_044299 [Homalodisca vitripennis]
MFQAIKTLRATKCFRYHGECENISTTPGSSDEDSKSNENVSGTTGECENISTTPGSSL